MKMKSRRLVSKFYQSRIIYKLDKNLLNELYIGKSVARSFRQISLSAISLRLLNLNNKITVTRKKKKEGEDAISKNKDEKNSL